eukprot:gene316-512_t
MKSSVFSGGNAGSKSKFSSVNLNASHKRPGQDNKTESSLRHAGPGNLSSGRGRAFTAASVPKPSSLILPSLRKECGGHDPTVSLVSGSGGWNKKDEADKESPGRDVNGEDKLAAVLFGFARRCITLWQASLPVAGCAATSPGQDYASTSSPPASASSIAFGANVNSCPPPGAWGVDKPTTDERSIEAA